MAEVGPNHTPIFFFFFKVNCFFIFKGSGKKGGRKWGDREREHSTKITWFPQLQNFNK